MANNTLKNQPEYKLFMLRLWRPSPHEAWRLAIQPAEAEKPKGLPTVDALNQFVLAQMTPTEVPDKNCNSKPLPDKSKFKKDSISTMPTATENLVSK